MELEFVEEKDGIQPPKFITREKGTNKYIAGTMAYNKEEGKKLYEKALKLLGDKKSATEETVLNTEKV